jgi:hypothetical protein
VIIVPAFVRPSWICPLVVVTIWYVWCQIIITIIAATIILLRVVWVNCHVLNVQVHASDTISSLSGQVDKASVTPIGTPRVLDNPVVLACFLGQTNKGYTVIDACRA